MDSKFNMHSNEGDLNKTKAETQYEVLMKRQTEQMNLMEKRFVNFIEDKSNETKKVT